MQPHVRRLVGIGGAALGLCAGLPASAFLESREDGYVVFATGACLGTRSNLVGLHYRRPGALITTTLGGAWSAEEYDDSIGKFRVRAVRLSPGQWEIANHEVAALSGNFIGKDMYRFPFSVTTGKVTYLGRFCAASQDEMVVNWLGRSVRRAKVSYVLITGDQARDMGVAATMVPELAGLEVLTGVPAEPSSITPMWRGTPLEPALVDAAEKQGGGRKP